MYLDYFGLDEAPFSITPDPSFIYLSGRHRDALAHLLYGVGQGGSGGFVQLTGEVGTGKTTLCRALLEQVPEGTHIALVLNPLMGPVEMLAAICEELGIATAGVENSPKALVDRLNAFLLAAHEAGERVVLVIDEAQNLSIEALEQVRLLTNLETSKNKLLQIILLGQPELRDLLRRRSLRQLAQRITARYHLTPLGPEETARYVAHRLAVAGAARDPFVRSGRRALFERSQGVPRLINIIADRAMVGAFAAEKDRIDGRLVHAAADEIQLGEPRVGRHRWQRPALAGAAVLMLAAGAWGVMSWWEQRPPVVAAPTTAAATPVANGLSGPGNGAMTAAAPVEPAAGAAPLPPASASDMPGPAAALGDRAPTSRDATPSPPGERSVREGVDKATGTQAAGAASTSAGAGTETVAAVAADATTPAVIEPFAESAPQSVPQTAMEPALAVPDAAWFEDQDLRAWPTLARAWGAPEDAALLEASCLGRDGLGYQCLEEQGTWQRIRQLGLPVVLVLPGVEPRHLLLTGIDGERLSFGAGEALRVVDRAAIESRWYGDYLVAWPQAPNWPREIARGDQGEAVERVVALAGRAEPPYAGAMEFGEDFERWLMDFQLRNGLEADGIVGPRTLLYLMSSSIEEPRLLTALDRNTGI